MVYTYHSFLIHSSADGYLGCFQNSYISIDFQNMEILLLYIFKILIFATM